MPLLLMGYKVFDTVFIRIKLYKKIIFTVITASITLKSNSFINACHLMAMFRQNKTPVVLK